MDIAPLLVGVVLLLLVGFELVIMVKLFEIIGVLAIFAMPIIGVLTLVTLIFGVGLFWMGVSN